MVGIKGASLDDPSIYMMTSVTMHLMQTPLPVPTHPIPGPPRSLNDTEQAEYDRVLAHFASADALTEDERMWLVRRFFLFFFSV